ncbi:hypothetical protein A605_07955 [Corynebacterium halotolerans YIM 70093 = DSM 44683]|uniref:Uncharacterized protein n=1 Tax=Corynebacterium halotolerans YIM 70093 = DSM 44683 TaxID=1121362 RepID=M1NMK8_9CORY|nr:hypothetical protein A605_07955 [Corynebacterium halotolerans YIM 70093 = DSM 44683]
MDKTELAGLLAEADRASQIAADARQMMGDLAAPEARAAGQVLAGTRLHDPEFTADIITHGGLRWPTAFYTLHELEHIRSGADILNRTVDSCREIPALRETARHADAGFLGRLFRGDRVRRGEEAAGQLRRMLADPQRQSLLGDTTSILARIRHAAQLQQGGVRLFPGAHGTPPTPDRRRPQCPGDRPRPRSPQLHPTGAEGRTARAPCGPETDGGSGQ